MAKKNKVRYVVTDTKTGRTGRAEERSGYLLGGGYVNPYWEIFWDEIK